MDAAEDENSKLVSDSKAKRDIILQREKRDADAVRATIFNSRNHRTSPRKYVDYSYQQNFGVALGMKEPGSIPLLNEKSSSSAENSPEVIRDHRFRRFNSTSNCDETGRKPYYRSTSVHNYTRNKQVEKSSENPDSYSTVV